jgi:hypothetical protein
VQLTRWSVTSPTKCAAHPRECDLTDEVCSPPDEVLITNGAFFSVMAVEKLRVLREKRKEKEKREIEKRKEKEEKREIEKKRIKKEKRKEKEKREIEKRKEKEEKKEK